MLKASAGGGGKGMRIAWNEKEVQPFLGPHHTYIRLCITEVHCYAKEEGHLGMMGQIVKGYHV